MSSFHALWWRQGVPACANKHLLKDTMRDEWGFQGMVISDAGAVDGVWVLTDNRPFLVLLLQLQFIQKQPFAKTGSGRAQENVAESYRLLYAHVLRAVTRPIRRCMTVHATTTRIAQSTLQQLLSRLDATSTVSL